MTALLKPRPSGFPNPLTELEDLLETVCGRTARFADSSGTYLLRQTPTPIRGRVRAGGSPMSLAVHAVVLDGIESSGELLGELNDLNTSTSSARVFHRDRQVIAQVDLPLHGLDAHALRAAIGLVDDIAAHVMPTLATVFGGSLGGDAGTEPVRRPDTTVYAEVVPGTMTVLNGPNADAWPFPAAVHVITARTVHGSPRSADTNHRIRRAISVDIVERGARFVDGEAYTSADEVGEPCLVAWGLSRSAVVAIARRAGQGSIFEIDADEVRLVSCLDETTLSWPRIAGRQAD